MTLNIISPFLSNSILVGMFISLVLVVLTFYKGLLNMPVTNGYRVKTISLLSVVLLFWAALAIILARGGFFAAQPLTKFQFPNIVYIFIPILLGLILLNYSRGFNAILNAIPLPWLIGIQVLRTEGAVFLIIYSQHLLPAQFAVPAGIGDFIVGITAPLLAYMCYSQKKIAEKLAKLWNISGTLDLVLALTLGFLTSPSPVQLFALDSPNRLIGTYPLVLVPAFALPLFLLCHIFTFRKLKQK